MSGLVRLTSGLLTIIVVCSISGCGSGIENPATAYASGSVTMNGKPVTAGRVMFYPTANKGKDTGKAAQGQLNSSGEFELSTYDNGDGAVVGEHTVTVLKPNTDGEAGPLGSANPERVTVKADGNNNFKISIGPLRAPPRGRRSLMDDEDDNEDD